MGNRANQIGHAVVGTNMYTIVLKSICKSFEKSKEGDKFKFVGKIKICFQG